MTVADPALALYCRPGFMNPGVVAVSETARVLLPADSLDVSRPIAARVIRAYQRAATDRRVPAPSLWDAVANQHREFLEALTDGNVEVVSPLLSEYFRTSLVRGLSRQPIEGAEPVAFKGHAVRTADALVSLAHAAAVLPVPSIEQAGPLHHQAFLPHTFETLLEDVERATALDLSIRPAAAANSGWQFGPRSTNVDVLLHSYTVLQLKRMGMTPADPLVEIGGGYGCLAALALTAGFRDYTIYDLPWVNAVQGYLLIRTFGADAVRLYGEDGPASVNVLPFWTLDRAPDKSVALVVNVNSLPEIGHATARTYIASIARVSRAGLFSINQEARAVTSHGTRQLRVWDLVREVGGLELATRHPYWMEQGYVEELYRPSR